MSVLLSAPLPAATYYVAANGNDASDGLSPDTPWATLQHAADTVTAGDMVIVGEGSYKGFNLSTSGGPGVPITFTANPGVAAPDPAVVIDRPNDFTGLDYVNLEGASHVVVEGFTIQGSGDPGTSRAGIRTVGTAEEPARFNVIRHNRVDLSGKWGIFSGFADDLVIEYNEISRAIQEHGIYVSNSGDRPAIVGNLVWDNHANGIHMNGDASLGGDGVISGAVVERNVIHGNGAGGGSGINCDGVQNSMIRNNLIFDNHASGISLYRIDGGEPSTGNMVINNTVVNAAAGRWCMNIQDGSHSNTLSNNIFWNDHPERGSVDLCGPCVQGLTSDHNAVMDRFAIGGTWIDFQDWKRFTGQDGDSFLATPEELVVSHPERDYRLFHGSLAVDSGTAIGARGEDLVHTPRPQGPAFDIGAYELAVELLLGAPLPGLAGESNSFVVRGAEPQGTVRIVWGADGGSTPVPGCPGLSFQIADARSLVSGSADAVGEATLSRTIPPGAAGRRLHFQAVEPGTCEVSGPVPYLFP